MKTIIKFVKRWTIDVIRTGSRWIIRKVRKAEVPTVTIDSEK